MRGNFDYPSVIAAAATAPLTRGAKGDGLPRAACHPRNDNGVPKQMAQNRGHLRAEDGRNFCRYSVYDNKTDFPIIIDGTADECAAVLHRSRNSFYCLVNRVRKGKVKKYTILRRFEDEEEQEVA